MTENVASKLRAKGVTTVEYLAIHNREELKQLLTGVAEDKIKAIQEDAWKKLGYWFTPANQLETLRKSDLVLPTKCEKLDALIGGGFRSRCISEVVGPAATGKTETGLTLLVETLGQNPNYQAIWYDSEGSFNSGRVNEMAKLRGYADQNILDRVILAPIFNVQHFQLLIQNSAKLIKTMNVKIIVVDSIIAPLRAEYVARENLAERQQILNKILRVLLNFAKSFNIVVFVTNQVSSRPEVVWSRDPVQTDPPAGGHIMGHNAELRLYLRKGQENKRIARLIDSSFLPPGETSFAITERGIEDVPEPEKKVETDGE